MQFEMSCSSSRFLIQNPLAPYSLPFTPHLLDHFVRSRQHVRWNPDDFRFSILDFRFWAHRITLSALASTLGGIVWPICLAVLRLITNSNFVGCSTGRSAALAPLRILSTKTAARRY